MRKPSFDTFHESWRLIPSRRSSRLRPCLGSPSVTPTGRATLSQTLSSICETTKWDGPRLARSPMRSAVLALTLCSSMSVSSPSEARSILRCSTFTFPSYSTSTREQRLCVLESSSIYAPRQDEELTIRLPRSASRSLSSIPTTGWARGAPRLTISPWRYGAPVDPWQPNWALAPSPWRYHK